MSGRWMAAGGRFAHYSEPGHAGPGSAGNVVTRAVLRELCLIAADAGIVHTFTAILAQRVGISDRQARRALARLESDGWITRPIRGIGNRGGTSPRASVYVLRPLPDAEGKVWPDPDWVAEQWPRYASSRHFVPLERAIQRQIHTARRMTLWTGPQPVDNPASGPASGQLQPDRTGPTTGPACPPVTKKTTTTPPPAPPARAHPAAVARARAQLKAVPPK